MISASLYSPRLTLRSQLPWLTLLSLLGFIFISHQGLTKPRPIFLGSGIPRTTKGGGLVEFPTLSSITNIFTTTTAVDEKAIELRTFIVCDCSLSALDSLRALRLRSGSVELT